MDIPQEIKTYLESLLRQSGRIITVSEKDALVEELYEKLDAYIAKVITENLPQEYLEQFAKLNDENKPQAEIEQFLKDKMPNSRDIFKKTFFDFKNTFLENSKLQTPKPE